MKHSNPERTSAWSGVWLSLILAAGSVVASAWWVAHETGYLFSTHKIAAAISLEDSLGSTLIWQLARFVSVLLGVHACFGLAAFGLARLTEAAFPGVVLAKRGSLVTGWFVVLCGIAMAANTTWHPSSIFAGKESIWRADIAGMRPVQLVALALALVVILFMWRARSRLCLPRPAHAIIVAAAVPALVTVVVPARMLDASVSAVASDRPHVVIIGIDSLRNDLQVPRIGAAETPHVAAFLSGARRFSDTTTPLARTYPSWMSILTGRHPVTTNARYNLMPRRLVNEGETLPEALRNHGYRTTYATDEVRFANIDESFGFDERITPPIGAVDFLLGFTGDLPLVNLIAATPLGAKLFPSNHANRAAYVTYRPRHFVERLDRELEIEGPSFLAIHLTLAHWPYAWAGKAMPKPYDEYRASYGAAVAEVDRQFSQVMELLREKSVLENAIVVLLSDHGEALGADSDSMLRKTGSGEEIWETLWGHGTSVLSPNQYQVLLAIRSFGRARLPGTELNYDWPVSLEDIRPTLEEFATGVAPTDVDGMSLLPYMAEPMRASSIASRVRFTETDIVTRSVAIGRYEASGILSEAAFYYELDHDSGWVQLQRDSLGDLIAVKQRAALSSDSLLAYVPDRDGKSGRYLFTDRDDPQPLHLNARPDPDKEPEAARLWDALMARFPGELPAGSSVPRM